MLPNPNEPLTRKILEEVINERMPLILGQFTDDVLLPAVGQIVRNEVVRSEHQLKNWLDERLADVRSDIIVTTRKEDRKLIRLVDMLRQKKVLDDPEVKELLGMEPFAIAH